MTVYVRRLHDELLRAVLNPAVTATRLVVVRGGSSTGKTRAAYEAVTAWLVDWRVDYPRNAAALTARLDAGIPARTVLWLGELRQYADDDGGAAVLGRLADLLEGTGHVLVTTVWPEHWTAYIAAARARPGAADPAGVAGRLLAPLPELTGSDPARIDPGRGGVIDVPPTFTFVDLNAVTRTGDPALAAAATAAAAAGQEGQVTQYLAGVPDLLDRYAGPGGDPYGQAVITAAIDATRLGHASALPAALIQQAAVGYLTGPQRTKDIASWRETALAWATAELKGGSGSCSPSRPPPAPAWSDTRSPTTSTSTAAAPVRTSSVRPPCGTRSQPTLSPPATKSASDRPRITAGCTATPQSYGQRRQLREVPKPPDSSSPSCARRTQSTPCLPPTGPPARSASTTSMPSPCCCTCPPLPAPGPSSWSRRQSR